MMNWPKPLLFAFVPLAMVLAAGIWLGLPLLNSYQVEGETTLPGLKGKVTVTRDEKGMAFIRADDLSDALKAQGFVTAQDRLFQMQLTRLLAQGRISELVGEAGRELDIRHRTVGLHRIAKRHAKILGPQSKAFFQDYVDGVNAFIENHPDDLHLEFRLAGIPAEPWTIADSLSVLYYMSLVQLGQFEKRGHLSDAHGETRVGKGPRDFSVQLQSRQARPCPE